MKRARVLLRVLAGAVLVVACDADAGRTDDEPDLTPERPIFDEDTRAELQGRLDEAEQRLEAFGEEVGLAADSAGVRVARGLDSLRMRAAELRNDLGRLGREAEESRERGVDDVRASLDSLDRELWSLRFEAAADVETFERTADRALASLETEMAAVEREVERAGDGLDTETRGRWGQLQGEYVELRAEAETIAEATSREARETFDEARRGFGRKVALLGRELRLLAAEIRGPDDSGG